MTRKRWQLGLLAGLLLAGSGCVTPNCEAVKIAYEAGPNCEIPLCDREHTYAILINGVTSLGLNGLRDALAQRGFTKVYSTQLYHVWWLEWEMRQIVRDDKSARFVLVGYDASCPSVLGMAHEAARKKIPVDAVMLINPVGTFLERTHSARTVVVTSDPERAAVRTQQTVTVADAGHWSLPTHPRTVETLMDLLKITASHVVHPPVYSISDKNLPLPGLNVDPTLPPEWRFLEDQPGPHSVPLTPIPPAAPLPDLPPGILDGSVPPAPLPAPRKVGDK